jgi:AcrR family transcriptional regulator
MAPKLIDKEQKRAEIAMAAFDYVIVHGMKEFSTTKLIKHMGIGKSSLYHYFESKDEILIEMFSFIEQQFFTMMDSSLEDDTLPLREKLNIVFSFHLEETPENLRMRELYKEFISLYLEKQTDDMKTRNETFYRSFYALIEKLFQSEVENKRMKPEALNFIASVIATADGMLMYSISFDSFELKQELSTYFDNFISLMELPHG